MRRIAAGGRCAGRDTHLARRLRNRRRHGRAVGAGAAVSSLRRRDPEGRRRRLTAKRPGGDATPNDAGGEATARARRRMTERRCSVDTCDRIEGRTSPLLAASTANLPSFNSRSPGKVAEAVAAFSGRTLRNFVCGRSASRDEILPSRRPARGDSVRCDTSAAHDSEAAVEPLWSRRLLLRIPSQQAHGANADQDVRYVPKHQSIFDIAVSRALCNDCAPQLQNFLL
ncbi:hypothetical protein DFR50_10242 [Roseiarcus fermentans]|uniref:Uncharacterized protein n=1 Tax=Roseiarcus fermentans TaxID=1473586 RepID=A0A366FSP7_9HYPH|nr:hypothetical protein DFR50_10242 [Roseiarcus fermentans]